MYIHVHTCTYSTVAVSGIIVDLTSVSVRVFVLLTKVASMDGTCCKQHAGNGLKVDGTEKAY